MSKTVVARIEAAVSSIEGAIDSCIATRSSRQILESLAGAQVLASNSISSIPPKSRTFTPVKKSLTALSNALDSLHSGVESRDLSLSEFRDLAAYVKSKFALETHEVLRSLSVADDPVVEDNPATIMDRKLVVRSTDLRTALKTVREHLNDLFHTQEEAEDAENPFLQEHTRSEQAYKSREEKEEALLKDRIAHVAGLKSNLPLKLKGPFQLLRLPIVPIFDAGILSGKKPTGRSDLTRNFSSSRLLDSLGIGHIMVQDYLILEEQVVLAIDSSELEDFIQDAKRSQDEHRKVELKEHRTKVNQREVSLEKKADKLRREEEAAALEVEAERKARAAARKAGMPVSPVKVKVDPGAALFDALKGHGKISSPRLSVPEKPRKAKLNVSNLDYVQSILDTLNEKSPSKYNLVTDYFVLNPRNTDIQLYWLMPRKTLSALISKGWTKVKNWGFPW